MFDLSLLYLKKKKERFIQGIIWAEKKSLLLPCKALVGKEKWQSKSTASTQAGKGDLWLCPQGRFAQPHV